MNLPKLTEDLNIIQTLSDQPTLNSEELKAEFDKAGNIIKNFINNILLTQLNKEFEDAIKEIKSTANNIRPIGSLYISTDNVDPSTIWIGTSWEKIEDVFLLASGKRAVGTKGGQENVTLGINNMPSHTHVYHVTTGNMAYNYDKTFNGPAVENISTVPTHTTPTGEGQAFSIMPPYLAVNVWKRIS